MASLEERHGKTGTTWRVRWWKNGKVDGQITFDSPEKAARFKQLVELHDNTLPPGWSVAQRASAPVPTGKLTFGQWARQAISQRSRASARTRADYLRDLDRHFGLLLDRPLAEIDADEVTVWLDDRHDADLSAKTIRNLNGFASSLYVQAMAQHPPVAAWNPFAGRLPDHAQVKVEEMVFMTPEEFNHILGFMRAEYRPLFRLLFGTGLRFGEATALTVGDTVQSGPGTDIRIGNAMPLAEIPLGSTVHNLELRPGKGGQLARSAGAGVQVVAKEGDFVTFRLPSTEMRMVRKECMATIGQVGNVDHSKQSIGKAGANRWRGWRPKVRGVAMNPVDHPLGGGEGKSSGGRHPVSPWGQAEGAKTRKSKKPSTKLIVRGRKRGRATK